MMQSAGIVVNDVTVTWRNGHTALRDASFTVPSGSIAALVGVNGSGKSTLFKAIMGFVRLTSGKISVLGIPTRQALQKNLVAYVPQSEDVDWSFPVLVEDVVMMGRYGHMGMLRIHLSELWHRYAGWHHDPLLAAGKYPGRSPDELLRRLSEPLR